MRCGKGSGTRSLEAESNRVPDGTPPWVVDQLYRQFLEDFWSSGAGELSSRPLDAARAPREVYVSTFSGRRTGAESASLEARSGCPRAR